MSDDIITLELRQSTANNVNAPGDFRTVLNKAITIEEGDSISVDKVFLDTTSQTDSTVNIPDDMIMDFEYYIWVNNIFSDGKSTDVLKLDGMKHIPCLGTTHPGGLPGFSVVTNLIVGPYDTSSDYYGNFSILFNYIDINNQPAKVHIFVPVTDYRNYDPLILPIGVICKDGSFTLDSTMNLLVINSEPYNIRVSTDIITPPFNFLSTGITAEPVTSSSSFTPVSFHKLITISAGSYTPGIFADTISKLMTTNNQTGINQLSATGVQNELLKSSADFPSSQYTFVNAESSLAVPKENAGTGFIYDSSNPIKVWLGTNQFALQFDPTSNRYILTDIHMPIYVDGNKCTVLKRGEAGNVYPACAYSGISIKNITCSNKVTGEIIPNFAYEILGLQIGKLSPSITYVTANVIGSALATVPNFQFLTGVNFTEGFNGIDEGINKDLDDTAQQDISKFSIIGTADNVVNVIGDTTSSIFGDNIYQSGSYTFGYYKIEINSVFKNLLVGEEIIQRNIMAIVSKYYESNSYTDGDQSGAIPYIHKGVACQLSSFGVRVLNSNNELPTNIRNDNTVFIRIIKAQKNPNK